jgi:ABC-type multidrug transport system ATPase subunit
VKLVIQNLHKTYRGNVHALRDLNLEIGSGVLGLLGPNGAGKSTLMRILATITAPTSGTVTWNGTDLAKSPDTLRSVLGYLPQDFGVYPNLNAVEFLEYLAAIKGVEAKAASRRINELLELVNLVDARKRPLRSYSGGMKQRLGIAQALLNDPRLLIVDEPTVGLDPEERARFRHLLTELAGERIVILSTHIVSDVEATATQLALIHRGKLLLHTTPEKLLRMAEGKVWEALISSEDLTRLRQQYVLSGAIRRFDGVHVRIVSSSVPAARAANVAPTLEDAYLFHITASKSLQEPVEREAA